MVHPLDIVVKNYIIAAEEMAVDIQNRISKLKNLYNEDIFVVTQFYDLNEKLIEVLKYLEEMKNDME